jgi:hypothetical protein
MRVLLRNPRPSINRVLDIVDENDDTVRIKGTVTAVESEDGALTRSGESYARTTFYTLYKAIRVQNGQTDVLVLFNRKTDLAFSIGDEVWLAGTYKSPDRFLAYAAISPRTQSYADLTKSSLIQLGVYILMALAVTVSGLLMGYTIVGITVSYVGLTLLSTGFCILFVCGRFSNVRSSRANTRDWKRISELFNR